MTSVGAEDEEVGGVEEVEEGIEVMVEEEAVEVVGDITDLLEVPLEMIILTAPEADIGEDLLDIIKSSRDLNVNLDNIKRNQIIRKL